MNPNKKLVIISKEKIFKEDNNLFCDNVDMKSIPEGLSKNTEVSVIAIKSKIKRLYKTRELVVYPSHGVGKVIGVEEQEIGGDVLEVYVVSFEKDKMTLRVPLGKAEVAGMRRLSTRDEMGSVVTTLKSRAKVKRTMWSRRAQDYQEKLNSGNPVRIAEVLRDLHRAEDQPEQSYSERQLYEAALDRLAREFAAVEKIDQDAAEKQIETFLLRAA